MDPLRSLPDPILHLEDAAFLRSLRNEASRQADFFASRNVTVSKIWNDIETLAHLSLSQRRPLRLILCEL